MAPVAPSSEVVGDTETSVARGRLVVRDAVARIHRGRGAVTRIELGFLTLIQDVEDRDVEGKLLVSPLRAVLDAAGERVLPRGVTGIARTRRLATAPVVDRGVAE